MFIFQKRRSAWRTTLSLAKTDNEEWRNAQGFIDSTQLPPVMTTRENRVNRWKRPMEDWIKCNYDGSYKAGCNTRLLLSRERRATNHKIPN